MKENKRLSTNKIVSTLKMKQASTILKTYKKENFTILKTMFRNFHLPLKTLFNMVTSYTGALMTN